VESIENRGRRIIATAVLLGALVAGASSADPLPFANGADPQHGSSFMDLEEIWTLGGGDDDIVFGVIGRVLHDDNGETYLLDSQLSEITVVSPAGEVLRKLGREGDGPGEFRNPTEMCFLPHGGLGVLQGTPGRVVCLDRDDGSPAGTWSLSVPESGGMLQMEGLKAGGDRVVVSGTRQTVDAENGLLLRDEFLAYVDAGVGLVRDELVGRSHSMDLNDIRLDESGLTGGPAGRYDVLPDGRMVVAVPRNGYEVSIFAPDGSLDRIFTREFEPWKRDEQASDIWRRILAAVSRRLAPGCETSWEDTEPDVQSLRVAPGGDIWILNSRGRWAPRDGVFATFDVFSSEGVFTDEVHVICDGDPRRDMLLFAGDDMVIKVGGYWDAALARFGGAATELAEGEEPRPMTVTCYRIMRDD